MLVRHFLYFIICSGGLFVIFNKSYYIQEFHFFPLEGNKQKLMLGIRITCVGVVHGVSSPPPPFCEAEYREGL